MSTLSNSQPGFIRQVLAIVIIYIYMKIATSPHASPYRIHRIPSQVQKALLLSSHEFIIDSSEPRIDVLRRLISVSFLQYYYFLHILYRVVEGMGNPEWFWVVFRSSRAVCSGSLSRLYRSRLTPCRRYHCRPSVGSSTPENLMVTIFYSADLLS